MKRIQQFLLAALVLGSVSAQAATLVVTSVGVPAIPASTNLGASLLFNFEVKNVTPNHPFTQLAITVPTVPAADVSINSGNCNAGLASGSTCYFSVILKPHALGVATINPTVTADSYFAGKLATPLSVDVKSPALSNVSLLIGSSLGLLKTTNGGASWTQFNSGYVFSPLEDVRQIAATNDVYYASTSQNGLFKSNSAGASWSVFNQYVPGFGMSNNVMALQVDDAKLFIGTEAGFSVSANSGATWMTYNASTPGFSPDPYVSALAVSGVNYFAVTSSGLSYSVDSGATWQSTTDFGAVLGSVQPVTVSISAGKVYVGTSSGLAVATIGTDLTNPASWTDYTASTTGFSTFPYVRQVLIVGDAIYVATQGGLSVSVNAGTTWKNYSSATAGFSASPEANKVVVNGANIYVGTTDGLSISTNAGVSWTTYGINTLGAFADVSAISVNGNTLIVGDTAGVSISTDNGATWSMYSWTNIAGVEKNLVGVQAIHYLG
tara:strand:- start:47 stop:1525 length:1479 start_codon:yes stop_codon:yes gene_type:complete